jgi:P-type conjugative transfer protein TrbL
VQTTILTDLVNQFLRATSAWYQALLPVAKSLFVTLAAIELTWSAAWWAIEQDDLNPLLMRLLRRLLTIGFFWTVLLKANVWVPAVIEGFVAAGKQAAAAAGT